MILEEYLRDECDVRLPGVLTLGIKEAYRYHEKLLQSTPILREPEMKKAYGHLRQGLIDVSLRWIFEKSEIENEIINKAAKNNVNGYTYLEVTTKGATISPVKTRSPKHMPRKALHRVESSTSPFQLDLFDMDDRIETVSKPFLLLTYGGTNHRLEFVELGIPDAANNSWLDKTNILHAPVVYESHTVEEMKKGLELTFTDAANELLKDDISDTR